MRRLPCIDGCGMKNEYDCAEACYTGSRGENNIKCAACQTVACVPASPVFAAVLDMNVHWAMETSMEKKISRV